MESQKSDEPQEHRSSEGHTDSSFIGIGCTIDWNSPLEDIVLCVELPFWLLIPSARLRVSLGDFATEVLIDNDAIEIQHGRQYSRTHRNTVFIGRQLAASNASAPVTALPDGGLFRGTRTLLSIATYAIRDALDAFFGEDGPRFQDGSRYFASLAQGHLPVINKVINAYRKASVDPFAREVTAWDVAVWFVCQPPRSRSVCLCSHLAEDWYPQIGSGFRARDQRPYYAATVEATEQHLLRQEVPGEIEMLDGWSLFHRGRYGDSIRSFVTAIEVLLEAEIRRLLMESGLSEEQTDSRIDSTRNNFNKRLTDYCELSKRRIPGPILHPIPYINGVRLREELDRTRRLRHKIVHHGHRLDHTYSKPMQRAAETTSWLFDWLSNRGDFEERRRKNSIFFFALRTNAVPFECQVQAGRIVVIPLFAAKAESEESSEEPVVVSHGHVVHSDEMLLRTISQQREDGKDLEHFVKMSFFELGAGEIEDSPFEVPFPPIPERFRMWCGGKYVPIFMLDTVSHVTSTDVGQIRAFLAERKDEDEIVNAHAILVANDQNDHEWYKRPTVTDTELSTLAYDLRISIVKTSDLARLVL